MIIFFFSGSIYIKIFFFINDAMKNFQTSALQEMQKTPLRLMLIWVICLWFPVKNMYCSTKLWKTACLHSVCQIIQGEISAIKENLKGQVYHHHQSLCTHPNADGKSGEVLWPRKHFWSFTAKQSCSILLNDWSRCGLVAPNGIINDLKRRYLHPMCTYRGAD